MKYKSMGNHNEFGTSNSPIGPLCRKAIRSVVSRKARLRITGTIACTNEDTANTMITYGIWSLTSLIAISQAFSTSQRLATRGGSTYSGNDALDPNRAGTFTCFKDGTWQPQQWITSTWDQACSTAEHDDDNHHFSFTPSADGTYPHQEVDHEYAVCTPQPPYADACNAFGYVKYTGDIKAPAHANTEDCEYAMERVVAICHGDNQDTRGGWYTFSDGTSYGADPGIEGWSESYNSKREE